MEQNTAAKISQQKSVDLNSNGSLETENRTSGIKRVSRSGLISSPSLAQGITEEGKDGYNFLKQLFYHAILLNYFIKIGLKNPITGSYVNHFIKIQSNFVDTFSEVVSLVDKNDDCEVYIAPVTYASENAEKSNVNYVTAMTADFDMYADQKLKELSRAEVELHHSSMLSELTSSEFPPSIIVNSGNGLHVYLVLKEPLAVTSDVVSQIEGIQSGLAMLPVNFKGDPSLKTVGHTLRLPGTENHKNPNDVKACTTISTSREMRYNFKHLAERLNKPVTVEQLPDQSYSETMYATYQKMNIDYETLRKAAGQCEFFLHMGNHPDQQSYVLWSHLALNLAVFGENGRVIFHNISKKHSSYQQDESERHFSSLEEKVKDAGYKPTSCSGICEAGFTCPKTCQQKSPAGMILSTLMKANKQQKLSVEVDLEAELKRIVPKLTAIENMRLINTFILEKINPSTESRTIKIAVLKEAMKILGISERGNLKELTTMIKVVSVQGGTGNFEVDMGEKILKAKDFICVAGSLMTYDQGVWSKYRGTIKQDIINQIKADYDKRVVESIEFYICNKSSKPIDTMNTHSSRNLICLSNGMLQMDEKGDFHLLPHQKEYFALNRLEIVFDPKAKCPRFLEFINNCFCLLVEEDRRITVDALQDFFGYCLVPGNAFHRFVLLIGKTRTGKSVIQDVLSDMLGYENVSNINISILDDPINTINLFDKLINIGPEFGARTRFNEEFFKSLTSGDGIAGRDHRKAPVSFKNGAKMMFAANEFPTILDSSGACYERAMCFPFDNFIPEEMRNIHLSEELIEERAGVLLWALQGRARLLKRGRFIESAAMSALKNKVKISNDPVLGWFNTEKTTLDPTAPYYTLKSWWDKYKNYCLDEEIKSLSRSKFLEAVKEIPGISISKPSTLNQECIICNWELLDPSDNEKENNQDLAFISEALEVTEVNNRISSPIELCPPVAEELVQDGSDDEDKATIIAMVQSNILQQDEDWSAFN